MYGKKVQSSNSSLKDCGDKNVSSLREPCILFHRFGEKKLKAFLPKADFINETSKVI